MPLTRRAVVGNALAFCMLTGLGRLTPGASAPVRPEHFPIKRLLLERQKMRPDKDPEPRSDAIRTEKALAKTSPWLSLPDTPELPKAARSGLTTLNGANIFFAQFGAGPHVLFLHGGLGNSNYWGHQVSELANSYSVTVMDTRGHGRSPLTSYRMSYKIFAEDAAALMDMLNVPTTAIVGWSDGAITGLHLAMRKPERVNRLFAFGANYSPDGLKPNGSKSAIFASYAERCRAEYRSLNPHPEKWLPLRKQLRGMWRAEPNFTMEDLARVKASTIICAGRHDEIIEPEHTERLAHAITGARLAWLPDVSHFAMLQDPVQFNKALSEFLTT